MSNGSHSIEGFGDLVTVGRKRTGDEHADSFFVIEDEDARSEGFGSGKMRGKGIDRGGEI